MSNLWSI